MNPTEQLRRLWANLLQLGPRRLGALAAIGLATFALVGIAGYYLSRPSMGTLYAGHLYVIRTPERDRLRTALDGAGIQTGLHYPVPLHRQPCLEPWAVDQGVFPVAEAWASQGLSLPIFAGMSADQQDRVIAAVRHVFTA